MIKLEQVNVAFKQRDREIVAVKDVSLQIKEGEIYGIVGGSGAGKSTLVRVINGLQKPTSGQVIIDGADITKLSSREVRKLRQKIGMIFQHFNLISRKTVGQNIEFALKIQKYPKIKRKDRAKELLELVGLGDKAEVYPASLSGGQKQRVAIARAIATEPKILLCDEATSALDVQTTNEIVDILRKINETLGITIVFITHQLEVAKILFDKIAVMNEGKIIEVNECYEIFANPKKEHTRKLVKNNIQVPETVIQESEGSILKLTYKGEKSVEPLINTTIKNYNVVISILHGKIEYIQGKAIGVLVISVDGPPEEITKAFRHIGKNVEEIQIIRQKECEAV